MYHTFQVACANVSCCLAGKSTHLQLPRPLPASSEQAFAVHAQNIEVEDPSGFYFSATTGKIYCNICVELFGIKEHLDITVPQTPPISDLRILWFSLYLYLKKNQNPDFRTFIHSESQYITVLTSRWKYNLADYIKEDYIKEKEIKYTNPTTCSGRAALRDAMTSEGGATLAISFEDYYQEISATRFFSIAQQLAQNMTQTHINEFIRTNSAVIIQKFQARLRTAQASTADSEFTMRNLIIVIKEILNPESTERGVRIINNLADLITALDGGNGSEMKVMTTVQNINAYVDQKLTQAIYAPRQNTNQTIVATFQSNLDRMNEIEYQQTLPVVQELSTSRSPIPFWQQDFLCGIGRSRRTGEQAPLLADGGESGMQLDRVRHDTHPDVRMRTVPIWRQRKMALVYFVALVIIGIITLLVLMFKFELLPKPYIHLSIRFDS